MPRALLFKIFLQFVRALHPQMTMVACGGRRLGVVWVSSIPSLGALLTCSPCEQLWTCLLSSLLAAASLSSVISSHDLIALSALRQLASSLTPLLLMAPPSLPSLYLLPFSSPCLTFSLLSRVPDSLVCFPVFHLSALPTRPQVSVPSSPLSPSPLSVALSHRSCPTQAARTLFSSKLPTAELLSVPGRLPGQGLCMFPWLKAVRGEAILLLCSQELV